MPFNIHVPKPFHDWKTFVNPIAAMVVGVLLAPGLKAGEATKVNPSISNPDFTRNSVMPFDFKHYLQAFNGTDEAAFVRRFYTEDLVVEGPPGVINGHQEWLNALTFIHDRIDEKLYPITVMQDGDTILAEIKGVFTAKADRADFPYGPIKSGESVTVKMLAKYQIRDGKIAHITLASWPSGKSPK